MGSSDGYLYPVKIRLNVLTSQKIEELLRIEYPEFDQVPQNRLLILLDALDEVHADYLDIASSNIEILSKKYSRSKIVVTCRNNLYITETDKRSAKLEGFSSYLISPLQYASVYSYLKDKVNVPPEEFIEDLRKKKFYELLYSPFYLVNLVEFYKIRKEIPASKKTVFEHLIAQRIENDFEKFANSGIHIQDQSHKIKLSIRELAAVAECLGRNYLEERTEVQPLVPDQKLLEIIKRTFLFNKSTREDRWEFEHNNFQEFLAASFLSSLSFEKIQQFVSFSPDFKKIKPSWLNTVSFLFSLIEPGEDIYNKLIAWIIDIEPDILVRFEKDKIELGVREKLFQEIYEDFESKHIIIRNEKFESEDLAMFVSDSSNIIEFLIHRIESSGDKIVITEALRILPYFDRIDNYSCKIRDLLESKLCNEDLSDEIKYACFNALAGLNISNKELTDKILALNDLWSSQYLRAGFYRYIKFTDHFEDHMNIALRGIELIEKPTVTKNAQPERDRPRLSDEKYALEELLEKIESSENVKAFLDWATAFEHSSILESIFLDQVGKMLKKAVESFDNSPELFDSTLNLLASFSKKYYRELGEEFRYFFQRTNTQLRAFEKLYIGWQKEEKSGFNLTYGMAIICNEECLNFLIKEIKVHNFGEPQTWQFRNALAFDGRSEMYNLYHQELLKIDFDKYAVKEIDFNALRKARRKRDLELLFSKKDFLEETKRIFDEETEIKGRLTKEELYDWKKKSFNDEEMTNTIVVETLRDRAHDKKFVELREIEQLAIEENRWLWFQLHKIVQYDQIQEAFEYSPQARDFATKWVDGELESANFRTAIEYTKGSYHYRYAELYISFFIQRLDIEVPERVYLDLLDVQCYLLPVKRKKQNSTDEDVRKPNTFEFVVEKIGRSKVIKRVLENLKTGNLVPAVKQSHFNFCQDFKVFEAAPMVFNEILNDEWNSFDQRTFITQFTELSSDYGKLLGVFDKLPQESKLHVAKKLAEIGFQPVVEHINGLLINEVDEEIKFRYIKIIGTIDKEVGFALLKKWILRNKRLPDHFASFNVLESATIDDLIEVFEDAIANDYGNNPWSNRNDYIVALVEKGSQNEYNYLKVNKQLNIWIGRYEDLKFLHYQVQNLEQKYYSKKSQVLTFNQAVELVKPKKSEPMSGEHQVKLKELEVELKRLEHEFELAKDGLLMSKRYAPMAMLSGLISLFLAFIAFMTTDREFLTGNQLIVIFIILALALLIYYSYIFGRIMTIKAKISEKEKEIEIEVGKGVR